MLLLERDIEILDTLAFKVRLMTVTQVANAWWPASSKDKAKQKIKELERAGFISRKAVRAKPMLALKTPVYSWSPGQNDPEDVATISSKLRTRWKPGGLQTAPIVQSVIYASRFTANLMGGAGGILHSDTATHDLHLAAVYLLFRKNDPESAAAWVGEDVKGKAGHKMKDPDAFIETADGQVTVIEFGGAYDHKKVLDFHMHCKKHNLSYQLW